MSLELKTYGELAEDVYRGAYTGIPFDFYRGLAGVSQSTLSPLLKGTPGEAKHRRENFARTRPMMLGTAVDRLVYEGDARATLPPADLIEQFKGANGWKLSTPGKLWLAEHKDDLAVSAKEMDQINGAAKAVLDHPIASALLATGHSQLSLFWEQEIETAAGLEMVARKGGPDTVIEAGAMLAAIIAAGARSGAIVDLKTCGAGFADREKWGKHAAGLHYDLQLADYRSALETITGDHYEIGLWIVVEMTAPYRCEVYRCGTAEMERGERDRVIALENHHACTQTGYWPTSLSALPDAEIQTTKFPPWAMR